jgi:cytochrome c oxidase assembly protein subunit 15
MRRLNLSPATYRRITLVAAVLLAVIIVTGAAVRLTKSGLGCPVGISCPRSQLQAHGPASEHATIEHVNRLFTGLVSVAVIVAVLGSLVRIPRRRDLTRLSLGLVVGVVVQAVLGQLTVEFDLKPQFVMAHFLVSIALLSIAIVLVRRAGLPDAHAHPIVSRRAVVMGRALLGLAAAVLFTGTVVTGAGPHSGGGTKDNVARLDFRLSEVARVHGTIVMAFLVAVLAMLWLVRHDRPAASVQRRVAVLLAVLLAQAGVGYAQYFSDIPPLLVGIHVAGATAVWSATLVLYLGLFERSPVRADASSAADGSRPLLARA